MVLWNQYQPTWVLWTWLQCSWSLQGEIWFVYTYNWTIIITYSSQQGYVLQQETVYNIKICSDVCISTLNCNWFSFSQSLEFCILFNQCSEIDPNPSFLSSQVDCKYEGGKLFSYFWALQSIVISNCVRKQDLHEIYQFLQTLIHFAILD